MVGQVLDERRGVPRTDPESLEKFRKGEELSANDIGSGMQALSELASKSGEVAWREYFDKGIQLQEAMVQFLSEPGEQTIKRFQEIIRQPQPKDTQPNIESGADITIPKDAQQPSTDIMKDVHSPAKTADISHSKS